MATEITLKVALEHSNGGVEGSIYSSRYNFTQNAIGKTEHVQVLSTATATLDQGTVVSPGLLIVKNISTSVVRIGIDPSVEPAYGLPRTEIFRLNPDDAISIFAYDIPDWGWPLVAWAEDADSSISIIWLEA